MWICVKKHWVIYVSPFFSFFFFLKQVWRDKWLQVWLNPFQLLLVVLIKIICYGINCQTFSDLFEFISLLAPNNVEIWVPHALWLLPRCDCNHSLPSVRVVSVFTQSFNMRSVLAAKAWKREENLCTVCCWKQSGCVVCVVSQLYTLASLQVCPQVEKYILGHLKTTSTNSAFAKGVIKYWCGPHRVRVSLPWSNMCDRQDWHSSGPLPARRMKAASNLTQALCLLNRRNFHFDVFKSKQPRSEFGRFIQRVT